MEKLNELVELAKKATSGKWIADSGEGWDAIISQQDMVNGNFIVGEFIGPDSKANKDFVLAASPENILAIAEAFRALEQRAEAAEAKLAELEKQEPRYQVQKVPSYGRESLWIDVASREEAETNELHGYRWRMVYDAPAPAINLAELVPDEDEVERIYSIYCTPTLGSKNALRHIRKEILRNIEEGE